MSLEGQERGRVDYRPEIDGLRAVAVAGVLLFHAQLGGATGGFTGVDIFLVISGYLITRIIADDVDKGRFKFANFYMRRARRILPALVVVLAAVSVTGLLLPTTGQLTALGEGIAASLLFVANIHFWREGHGYFDTAAELNPLMHLWSLSLEEQFYLIFPLFIVLVALKVRRMLVPALVIAMIGSFALAEMLNSRMPAVAYFMLPTRAWEFLVGAILAIRSYRTPGADGWSAPWFTAVGVALILVPYWVVDSALPFPGVAALPTVAGTALVLRFANAGQGVGRVLASRPLVGMGLISYSAFLWHQPLLAFGRTLPLNAPGSGGTIALMALTLGLATLTWRFVEQPFRHSVRVGNRTLFVGLTSLSAVLLSTAAFYVVSGGAPGRLSESARTLDRIAQHARARQLACYLGPAPMRSPDTACHGGARNAAEPSIAIIGDSHAAAIAPAVSAAAERQGMATILLTSSSCPPLRRFEPYLPDQRACADTRRMVFAHLVRDRRIGTVVMAARWTVYLERSYADNGEGGVEQAMPLPPIVDAERERLIRSIRETIEWLTANGKRVVLIYPVPEAGWDVPLWIAKAQRYGTGADALSVSESWVAHRNRRARTALDSVADNPRLVRLDPAAGLCHGGRCALIAQGEPLYFDDDHVTRAGAVRALSGIDAVLRR